MAAHRGFEPRLTVPETVVLPLDEWATLRTIIPSSFADGSGAVSMLQGSHFEQEPQRISKPPKKGAT